MPRMPLNQIKIGKRFRKDLGDVHPLADSIEEIGLLHPIVVNKDDRLVVGRRRLAACKLTNRYRERVPVTIIDIEAVAHGEYDENQLRKDFLPSERVAIGEAVEALHKKEAKERQGTRTDKHPAKLAESSKAESRDKTASTASMGRTTYRKAKEIVEAAEANPEKHGALKEEMDKTGRVSGVYKKLKTSKAAAAIAKEPPPLPKGPYRVIVADPPWQYDKRAADVSHRGTCPYPPMSLTEIRAYVPHSLARDDAILWLWTTNAHMAEALSVVKAWGFQQKTILTWAKHKMGLGDWLRGQTEHCLMAVRGKPTVTLTNQTTLLKAKSTVHSEKPEEFYDLVRDLCPGSRVELFTRKSHEGFKAVGKP